MTLEFEQMGNLQEGFLKLQKEYEAYWEDYLKEIESTSDMTKEGRAIYLATQSFDKESPYQKMMNTAQRIAGYLKAIRTVFPQLYRGCSKTFVDATMKFKKEREELKNGRAN